MADITGYGSDSPARRLLASAVALSQAPALDLWHSLREDLGPDLGAEVFDAAARLIGIGASRFLS